MAADGIGTRTVNELMTEHPATIAVFNRFGIDMCCGGGVSVDDAVRRDGLDRDAVCLALRDAMKAP